MVEAFGTLGRARIAIEVGTHSPWVSRLRQELGQETVVANPRQVKLITESSRKDDRLDAPTLTRLALMRSGGGRFSTAAIRHKAP